MSNKPKYGIVLTSMFKKDIKLAKREDMIYLCSPM
jgi:hypothetical protein